MRHNQNRRSRGRNNRKGPNPLTRSFESNGPDVKVRGTAAHIADKYMTLARDAQSSGDTVAAENYLQHAEHYYRIVMAAQAQFQQSQPQFREGGEDANYEDDRQVNGRPRDRFDFNGADGRNDDDSDDRYDNNNGGGGEGDDDRGYRPPMQQQGRPQGEDNRPQQDNRAQQDNRPRGPRPEQRYDRPRYDNRDNRDSRTIATTVAGIGRTTATTAIGRSVSSVLPKSRSRNCRRAGRGHRASASGAGKVRSPAAPSARTSAARGGRAGRRRRDARRRRCSRRVPGLSSASARSWKAGLAPAFCLRASSSVVMAGLDPAIHSVTVRIAVARRNGSHGQAMG